MAFDKVTVVNTISLWYDGLKALFFPERCLHCRLLLDDDEQYLCGNCLSALPRTGMNLYRHNQVEERLSGMCHIERGAAFCRYEKDSDFREMIHQAKYSNRPEIMFRLAQQVAKEWADSSFFNDIDIIVPVPMHYKKLRQRGYNQSDYIAKGLNSVLDVEVCTDALLRLRNDVSQTTQTHDARITNVQGAFSLNQKYDFADKTILLVDDVLTTGSTIADCAKQFGRKNKIVIFTLAISI